MILHNLIENAIKCGSGADPEVRVAARATGARVEVVVEDNGPGVPRELRQQVFRPFFRGPPPHKDCPGSGTGLAIVQRVAAQHGGDVRVEEAPGAVPGSWSRSPGRPLPWRPSPRRQADDVEATCQSKFRMCPDRRRLIISRSVVSSAAQAKIS